MTRDADADAAWSGDPVPVDLSTHLNSRLVGYGLVLRPWDGQDLPVMVELFDDPDIELRTPLPSPFTLAAAGGRLARSTQPDRLLLAVTTDGLRPLGEVLLTATGELGYMIGRAHRRQGLATRGLLLLRDHAHDAVGMAVLRLTIEPDNEASRVVARRAGFRLTRAAAKTVAQNGRECVLDVWEHGQPAAVAT